MTCPCTRAARRSRRRDVVLDLARSGRYHYLYVALRIADELHAAAREAPLEERDSLRELARAFRAGARFAQRGAE